MKKVTCLLAALLLACGLSWAQQITWAAADQGYENGQVIESVDFNGYVAGEFFKGSNNNEPKYYTTGSAIRCYGGNYFTITSDYVLTEIVFGFASGEGSNAITSDVGTYENGTWTGSANEVTFTIGGTTGHRRFATFTITYDEGGSPAPSITASNVEIAYDATEGAIAYTINNPVDGGELTAAIEAEWLTIGTVGETVPFTCSVNPDGERTATVTLTYTYNTDQTVTKNVTVTQTTNPNAPGSEANPYTVAQARAAIDAGTGTQGVYATGIVSAIPTAYNSAYGNITFNMVDEVGDEVFLQAYRCGGDEAANVAVGDVAVVYGNLTKYGSTYEFGQGCTLVSLTHPAVPSVTVTPAILDVDADEHEGTLEITYANIPEFISFDMYFCDVNGDALEEDPDWILAEIQEENDTYSVYYVIDANDGDARTAYFKVYTFVGEVDEVYAIVTVNQAAYVAPAQDYAELPFEFNGGRADIENTDGLTQNGLGTDYNANANPTTKLKFDGTGDWLLLQFDERPGTLTFDIKNNSFSGGTFKVQTSEDGVTYTDLETYTEITGTQNEEFTDLGENVRYIKWIYTNKDAGNVGLGNIALAEYVEPVIVPSITITPDNFELDANSHMAEVLAPITYQNIVVVSGSGNESFDVQYYDAEGQEIEQTWCSVGAAANGDTDFNLIIAAGVNEGNEARTAYFKLYGLDEEANLVYSNLVTVTQAAPVIDYAVLPFVWEGGPKADFLALNGVTAQGLGSDYASGNAPYLIKFDNTGDYIQVKCDQQPGKVTIGVKMIGGGDTSTITIQGSADGETFTDIEVLTISGDQNDELTLETTNAFADADRYVRMLFTKGSNVGVGPITIAKGSAPSIAVTPATIDLEATGTGQNGAQVQQFVVAYHNLDIESHEDFAVQFYDAEGEEQEQPTWITPNPAYVAGGNEVGYMVMLFIEGNTGVARSAYFKVYALGEEDYVYSNLVTINQAGAPQQYTLTVEPFENLELITFVNDEMVMEGDGEIQVNEGNQVMLSIVANEGYVMETLMVNGVNHVNDIADDFTYTFEMPAENVTISATAVEDVPPTPGEWVMVSLNDLTEDDVFVIVGVYDVDESSYAMPNDGSGAPSAVEVTMVGNTLSDDIADNLKWNLSIGEDGYTFYPDGDTATWLYCNNTNNGVRVGTNENNVFSMTPEGYLYNNATDRYIGIYNHQDWRCYTSINNNIKDQTFAFYKRVDEGSLVTYTLDIEGYGGSDGGYYLIASPVSMIRPTAENGFLTEAYDLYYFDQAQNDYEWRNYKAKHFNIASGKGYLYASQENTTLTFTGIPYEGDGKVALDYVDGVNLTGWNLIGNPYNVDYDIYIGNDSDGYAETNFFVMNENGDNFELAERSVVHPMEGVLVEATAAGQFALFSNENGAWGGDPITKLNIRVSDENGKGDFARIRFGEGNNLEKFMLNPNNTKIYFPVDNEEYAVVYTDNMGEMPLNFSAAADGTYTLNINPEDMEMEYLHLIDNMTGTEVDLLANPSYSFNARVNDNAARFTLVFAGLTGIEENSDNFAFFSNGNVIVSNEGNAMLQVVDMNGRIVKSENINGTTSVSVEAAPGVYMLRLVNGDNMKVQKIVVR